MACNVAASSAWANWYPSDWNGNERVEQLGRELAASTADRQDIPKALHDWICRNIYYDQDALDRDEYSALSAADVLREQRGVCEGIANLTQALFIGAEIPCIKVWGVAISEGGQWEDCDFDQKRVNHTWNEYYLDGQWYAVDCAMDMGNRYLNGEYRSAPYSGDYLAPDGARLAKTHLILRRGFDLPENIPDDWAREEIETAVGRNLVPLELLSDYQSPITEGEFRGLLGLPGGSGALIARAEAAVILGERIGATGGEPPPFSDIAGCSAPQREAVSALYQAGVMVGDGVCFFPDKLLCRQEAVALAVRIQEKEE